MTDPLDGLRAFIAEVVRAETKAAKIKQWTEWIIGQGWTLRLGVVDRRGTCVEVNPLTMDLAASELEKARRIMESAPGFSTTPAP